MSRINLFHALSNKTAQMPEVSPQPAKRGKDAWRSDPIVVPGTPGQRAKQFTTLARLLRSQDVMQISDPAIRTLLANVMVFDNDLGHWTELPKLTKGQAHDLISALLSVPKIGFGPVETATAEADETPVLATPAKPAKPASEPVAAAGIPAGWEVRTGKRGPYLAKIK
jgi:hypothetical protein